MTKDILDRLYAGDDPDVVRRVAHGEETLQVAGLTSPSGVIAESTRVYTALPRGAKMSMAGPPDATSLRARPRGGEGLWTTIQIQNDLELSLRSDEPERVAWLARLARKLREWLREGEP